MTGNALAIREQKMLTLATEIQKPEFLEQIKAALPGNVTTERFGRIALTALQEKPEISECEPNSIFRSLLRCAADGLLPDAREAAIVKRGNQATYQPMVGGFRKIAAEYGWDLRARVVFENDSFEHSEEPPTLKHTPVRPGEEAGRLIAVYAIAMHKDGSRKQLVVYPEEVAKRRKLAQTQNVWNTWEPQMWKKTAVRDLFKELPLGDRERQQRVLDASELDAAEAAAMLYGPTRPALAAGVAPDDQPVAPAAIPAAPSDADTKGGNQQAAEGAAGGRAVEPSAAPDLDDRIREAGIWAYPDGAFAGKTLNELLDLEGGRFQLWYALRTPKYDGAFREALELHVESQLPDLWSVYRAWQEAGSPAGQDFETWAAARKGSA